MKKDTIVLDVIHSMNELGYSVIDYHNGVHRPYNSGSCIFKSDVSNAKDLFFKSWKEAAEWLKSVDAWRPCLSTLAV